MDAIFLVVITGVGIFRYVDSTVETVTGKRVNVYANFMPMLSKCKRLCEPLLVLGYTDEL